MISLIRKENEDVYWDRRLKIAHRKINRKKYYGLGVEIEKYQDAVESAVDTEAALSMLKARSTESKRVSENFLDDVVDAVGVKDLNRDSGLFADIAKVFEDSFRKGTRRLFKKNGDRVDVEQFVNQDVVANLMRDQDKYFNNLSTSLKSKLRAKLQQGLSEGKSVSELAKDLDSLSKDISRNRAKTIARSELVKASSEGTKGSMEKAGIKEFMWLSARNDNVCEPGNFTTSINGQTFTSCRELDGTTWDKDLNHPIPVESSHPNCRCVLVANV